MYWNDRSRTSRELSASPRAWRSSGQDEEPQLASALAAQRNDSNKETRTLVCMKTPPRVLSGSEHHRTDRRGGGGSGGVESNGTSTAPGRGATSVRACTRVTVMVIGGTAGGACVADPSSRHESPRQLVCEPLWCMGQACAPWTQHGARAQAGAATPARASATA